MAQNDIETRLSELQSKIAAQRAKLELHGVFSQAHAATQKELDARWAELRSEINAQMHDDEAVRGKLDWLQAEVLKWVDSIDLDYRA